MTKRRCTSVDDIRELGTILSVWAHPDDETFACAGIMAQAVENGQKVVCITATRGEAGSQDEEKWPLATLGSVREAELGQALRALGVRYHHWLNYPDGGCADVDQEEAINKVASAITHYRPDTILTFGPDGLTGHNDHCTVSRWVDLARHISGHSCRVFHAVNTSQQYKNHLKEADEYFDIFFNIDTPRVLNSENCDICFCLPDTIRRRKQAALAAMPSQMTSLLEYFGDQRFFEAFAEEAFVED